MAVPKRKPNVPDTTGLAQIDALLLEGRLLDAYTFAQRFDPIDTWPGPDAQVVASRLVRLLGAPRRAAATNLRVLRQFPKHCTAIRNVAFRLLERFGPYRAWSFLQENPPPIDAATDDKADWFGALACTLTVLRDFDAAEEALRRAQAIDPKDPWLWVQECFLNRSADRFPEALKSAETALAKGPNYPAALESLADALVLVGRGAEGQALLEKAVGPVQSPALCFWLADRFAEQGKADRALRYLRQFETWVPLAEPEVRDALESRRAMVLHRAGKRAEAAEAAGRVKKHGFYRKMAERLSAAPKDARRHVLEVAFIKQRHMYCAPATLAMLSTFFGRPTDQDAVAEGITYDGTPAHKQREWAVKEGWHVQEFTLQWETAKALLDRGIPFAITTVDVASSHLQAVVGYDSALGTVLLRDPTVDQLLDCYADALIGDHRGLGPRCFLMLPPERRKDLDDIELADTAAYSIAVRVDAALEHHDAATARAAAQELARVAGPDHWMALTANYRIARVDRDLATALGLAEKLLSTNPTSPRLRQVLLNTLEAEGLESRRREWLERICAENHPHPKFLQQLADLLRKDSRKSPATSRLLRRILATMPGDAGALWSLGTVEWTRGRYDVAATLYRFASCLDPLKEGLARDYFLAARSASKDAECEHYLRRRWARLGADRGDSAATLSWALMGLGRVDEAVAVYEPAVQKCPEDENLKLAAARTCIQVGRVAEAKAWIERIRSRRNARGIAEATAMIAERAGDPRAALGQWRALADADPLDVGAQEQVARLVAETEGTDEAERYLEKLAADHPTQPTIVRLLAERLRYDSGRAEGPLQKLVALVPNDCWALNELAIAAIKTGRFDDAEAYVTRSLAIDAHGAGGHNIRAMLEHHRGNPKGAIEYAKKALHLNVDNGWALNFAFDAAPDAAARAELADFVESEMRAQSTSGPAIDAYCGLAPEALSHERRYAFVRTLVAEQPDLYVLRRATMRLLRTLGRDEEALREAESIVRRWPSDADDWLALASLRDARGDQAGKLAALERATASAPLALAPLLSLAQHFEALGDLASERNVLRRALVNAPFNPLVFGYLADCDLREKKYADAWPLLARAIQLNPGYGWAWNALRQLADGNDELSAKLEAFARQLAAERPRSTDAWLQLADTLTAPEQLGERLAALDRVLTVNPLLEEAHTRRIAVLGTAGRHEEALAAARTGAWGSRRRPAPLRWHEGSELIHLGRFEEAADCLEALTRESPDYSPGWRLLADTYERLQRWPQYDAVAQELVKRFPDTASSHGYFGDSLRRHSDAEGAIAAFEKALDIDERYAWAAQQLWHLVEAKPIAVREAALARLRAALGEGAPAVLEGAARLAVDRDDRDAALASMVRLCNAVPDRDAATGAALAAIVGKGWSAALKAALEPSVVSMAKGAAAPIWAELYAKAAGTQWPVAANAFLRGMTNRKALAWAAMSVIEYFGDSKDRDGLRRFLDLAAPFVYEMPAAWSMAGWAIGNLDLGDQVDRWIEGWRDRPGLQSIQLLYVANAGRDRHRWDDVLEAHRRAVELPEDTNAAAHWSWYAFEIAVRGDVERGREALAQARRRETKLSAVLMAQDAAELLIEMRAARQAGEPASIVDASRVLRAMGVRFAGKAWERYRVQILERGFGALRAQAPGLPARLVTTYYAGFPFAKKGGLRLAVVFFVASAVARVLLAWFGNR